MPIEYLALLAFLAPLAISFLITAWMIRLAPALKLVDIPNARKVHTSPTAKGGGLAIFAGWIFTAPGVGVDAEDLWVWGGIGLVIVALGLVDDVRPLPWQLRLGVQTIAAVGALFVFGGVSANGTLPLANYRLWPAAVLWIVGLTNAFNMLDNMDALSAGVAWIVAFLFAITSMLVTFYSSFTIHHSAFAAQLALMGALTGFLWFNWPPARIFMGDAGSTFLGFFFGTSSLLFAGISDANAWALVLCFLAIPWYDLVSVVSIRLYQGRSPFHADKQHFSHRLVALGLSPLRAVAIICFLALAIGAGGLVLRHWSNSESYWLWVYVAGCWLALAAFEYLTRKKRQTKIEPS